MREADNVEHVARRETGPGKQSFPERLLSVSGYIAAASMGVIQTVFARKDDLRAQVSE